MFDKLEKLILFLLSIIFPVMVVSIFLQIVMRYVFHSANSWAEELTRYALAWLTMLGASVAVRRGRHMNVDYFINKLPKPIFKVNTFITNILILAFFIVLIKYGFDLVSITHKQLSAAMSMPMSYAYLSIPSGGILMLLFTIESFLINRFNGKPKED
jgi:TRAP-type C4-dicarboxylate transport system permease small subunit